MNLSRIFVASAAAVSVLAAIACTATQRAPEVAAAPPPEPVAAMDAMPSHPALQNERTAQAPAVYEAPVVVAQEPAMTPVPTAGFVERAPRPDRN